MPAAAIGDRGVREGSTVELCPEWSINWNHFFDGVSGIRPACYTVPQAIIQIMDASPYSVVIAGGFVRDALLTGDPKDIDLWFSTEQDALDFVWRLGSLSQALPVTIAEHTPHH